MLNAVFNGFGEAIHDPLAPADLHAIESMLDELARSGRMPDGLLDALMRVNDPAVLERLLAKLQALGGEAAGERPLDNILDYYRDGDEPYELLWPLPPNLLPMPFGALDRRTQFHVLFAECKRRLTEGGALRNCGKLDEADAAFNECLARADQLDVAILRSDAYQGLMTVAEKRGSRAAARRYLQLAERERQRQNAPSS